MTARCEPPEHLRGVDGWHWVRTVAGDYPAQWHSAPHTGIEPLWANCMHQHATPAWAYEHWRWRYIAPVATPAEVDALRAEIMRAGQACFDAQQEAFAAKMDANEWCQKVQLWEDRVHRLRAEVASLRVTLGQQPAAEGAEPIGCPIPGMCAAVTATATLRALLAECADELEAEIRQNYAGAENYPDQQRRMARDLDVVNRARAALGDSHAP